MNPIKFLNKKIYLILTMLFFGTIASLEAAQPASKSQQIKAIQKLLHSISQESEILPHALDSLSSEQIANLARSLDDAFTAITSPTMPNEAWVIQAFMGDPTNIIKWINKDPVRRVNALFPDAAGRSIFHRAIMHQNKPLFDFLLENGADIEIKDKQGRTPLMLAVINGDYLFNQRMYFITELLRAGADRAATDTAGRSVHDLLFEGEASTQSKKQMAKLLFNENMPTQQLDTKQRYESKAARASAPKTKPQTSRTSAVAQSAAGEMYPDASAYSTDHFSGEDDKVDYEAQAARAKQEAADAEYARQLAANPNYQYQSAAAPTTAAAGTQRRAPSMPAKAGVLRTAATESAAQYVRQPQPSGQPDLKALAQERMTRYAQPTKTAPSRASAATPKSVSRPQTAASAKPTDAQLKAFMSNRLEELYGRKKYLEDIIKRTHGGVLAVNIKVPTDLKKIEEEIAEVLNLLKPATQSADIPQPTRRAKPAPAVSTAAPAKASRSSLAAARPATAAAPQMSAAQQLARLQLMQKVQTQLLEQLPKMDDAKLAKLPLKLKNAQFMATVNQAIAMLDAALAQEPDQELSNFNNLLKAFASKDPATIQQTLAKLGQMSELDSRQTSLGLAKKLKLMNMEQLTVFHNLLTQILS